MTKSIESNAELVADRKARFARIMSALKDCGFSTAQATIGRSLYPPITQSAVSHWNANNVNRSTCPSEEHVHQLATQTGYAFEYLWSGRGPEKPESKGEHVPRLMVELIDALRSGSSSEEARLYSIAPIGLAYMDVNLRFVYINQWLAKLNGLSPEGHIGRTIYDIVPEIAVTIAPQMAQVIATGKPLIGGSISGITAAISDKINHYRYNYFPDIDENGVVIGLNTVVDKLDSVQIPLELTPKNNS